MFFLSLAANVGGMASKGLRAISYQAEKLPERKDAHRKPQLPHLTGS